MPAFGHPFRAMLGQCPGRSVITVIWAILAAVGVPLWLCAAGILTLVARNRTLRKRPDNIPVRILRPGQKRWRAGARHLGARRVPVPCQPSRLE